MHIFYAELQLDDGFEVLDTKNRHDRLVRGQRVDRPSGWALFSHLRHKSIQCHFCSCQADRWVVEKGRLDMVGNPVLNLYATNSHGHVVMMTRDHIIPKSLGGKDCIENLRPACTRCNENRSNEVTPEVVEFAQNNPELIDKKRIREGLDKLKRHLERLDKSICDQQKERERLIRPFKDMGYL